MANNERLAKRVKKIEDWVKENEDMGGPQGILETMTFLINEARMSAMRSKQIDQAFQSLRGMTFGFVEEEDLTTEWDKYVEEQQNAVQEQQTEEVSVQEETESSEETVEAPEEESSEAKK